MITTFLFASAWQLLSDDNGYRVERREIADGYFEVRVRTHALFTPREIFNVAWDSASFPKFNKYAKLVKILKDSGTERVVYNQNTVPVLKDRDYTIKARYEEDKDSGLIQVFWDVANELGPPESSDHVRIKRTSGSWVLEPTPDGGTDITYVAASEAGGDVPQWIVNSAQKDAVPDSVRLILKRVAALRRK